MEQPTSKDVRAPINLRIKFRSESIDQFIERYSIDVSRGGIFIRTREPLAVGTQLKFDFQLQDAAPLMAGEGTVVWIREYDPNRTGVTPGMGVRFDKLTPTSQPVLDKILVEKGRRDQSAVSPGTTSKVGAGMAVRRPSSTFTALDPAVTGSGPVSATTGALPAARAAAILERTNLGYLAPSVPGAPPQMTLPSSPAKAMTPAGLATLESPGSRAGTAGGPGLVSRLTPTSAHKYEPPSSADIDKALDGLVPGGDATAGVSASGSAAKTAADDDAAAAPTGIVDPMSEPTQIADRLPDFYSAPTRIGGIDRSAEPKPSLDARLSALGAAVADTPATAAAKDAKDVKDVKESKDAKDGKDGKDKAAKDKDKVAALEAAPATAKAESKPAAAARKAPAANKRPTALIIGGALLAAIAVVVAATKLTSSDREQEAVRERLAAQPSAAPAAPPAPEPVPPPPAPAPAPVAAAEPVPAPAAATPPPPAPPAPAAAPEPEPAAASAAAENKTKTEPAAKPAKTATVGPRKTATVSAKKPAAPAEPAPTPAPVAAKSADDTAAPPTPEAQIPQSLLKISSTPAGAEVLLDGKSVGKTPYQGKQIDFSAPHAVTVKLDGYEPYEHMIGASDWTKAKNVQTAKVAVKLHKAGGATAAKGEGAKTETGKTDIGPPAVEVLTPDPIKPESGDPKKIESPPKTTP